jgi:outer membrane protein OmpU
MKKIIAAAVAAAFVAPAFAADVTLSGGADWYYKDASGTTETGLDSDAFSIKASTETANGISASLDFNITSQGSDDGGPSITLSGPFGTVDLGDTSGATDAFDDRTDLDVVVGGVGTGGDDAGMSWKLPALAEGLTVIVSHSADGTEESDAVDAGNGFGVSYTTGPVNVAYATNDYETNTSDETYIGATVTFGGLKVSAERLEVGVSGAESSEKGIGLSYGMGDLTFSLVNNEVKNTSGTVTDDNTFVGVKYDLGGGVTAFVENLSDAKTASDSVTAAGVTVKF